METVTITKAECDSFKAMEANCARLEHQVKLLMEQVRLGRHKSFGASSEKSVYNQPSLFDEAEASTDDEEPEPKLVAIEKHYRKVKRNIGDCLPKNLPVEIIE